MCVILNVACIFWWFLYSFSQKPTPFILALKKNQNQPVLLFDIFKQKLVYKGKYHFFFLDRICHLLASVTATGSYADILMTTKNMSSVIQEPLSPLYIIPVCPLHLSISIVMSCLMYLTKDISFFIHNTYYTNVKNNLNNFLFYMNNENTQSQTFFKVTLNYLTVMSTFII